MTKIVIPGSYVLGSLSQNWQKWEWQKAKMMKKIDVLPRLLLRWGGSCSVTFSPCGCLVYKLFSGHLPYSGHHGSWAGLSPLLMRGVARGRGGAAFMWCHVGGCFWWDHQSGPSNGTPKGHFASCVHVNTQLLLHGRMRWSEMARLCLRLWGKMMLMTDE